MIGIYLILHVVRMILGIKMLGLVLENTGEYINATFFYFVLFEQKNNQRKKK